MNWTAIGVIVAIAVGILGVIGWFVVHSLAKSRDERARRHLFEQAVSDFDIIIMRWVDAIIDKHHKLPTGFGVRLSGAFDMHVDALEDIRAESLSEIEAAMRKVRAGLVGAAKSRLDEAWKNYQEYQIEGHTQTDPATGQEFTTHVECKAGLTDCLKQMQKVAHE